MARAKRKETAAHPTARQTLIQVGTDLFRRHGYEATTVDQICVQAGVTKGAFFHHFESKEALAEACLAAWDAMAAAMEAGAGFQSLADPVDKVLGYMDSFIGLFSNPKIFKSCLAGTTVQEVADSHPRLRSAANTCFIHGRQRMQAILDAACRRRRKHLDTASLANLWMAALQGALILSKAGQDESVIPASLGHVQEYIRGQLGRRTKR